MSSREKPKVICVRSLVPKQKNSASLGDLVGRQGRARDLDHGAVEVLDLIDTVLLSDFGVDLFGDLDLIVELVPWRRSPGP